MCVCVCVGPGSQARTFPETAFSLACLIHSPSPAQPHTTPLHFGARVPAGNEIPSSFVYFDYYSPPANPHTTLHFSAHDPAVTVNPRPCEQWCGKTSWLLAISSIPCSSMRTAMSECEHTLARSHAHTPAPTRPRKRKPTRSPAHQTRTRKSAYQVDTHLVDSRPAITHA